VRQGRSREECGDFIKRFVEARLPFQEKGK